MRKNILVGLDEEKLPYPEKKEVLISGICKGILPASYIKTGEKGYLIYHVDGYIKLADLKSVSAENLLKILEKIIDKIEICENYLIFPEEYLLSEHTIFISDNYKDLKFIYVLDTKKGSKEASIYQIKNLIHQMRHITTDGGREYLQRVSSYIDNHYMGRKRLRIFIDELREEINLCHII